jgi:transcriptional regulator with XRE-family HTH domain
MNRIKEVLQQQGRTQVWLAKILGKSQPTVSLYLNNKQQPNLDVLFRIAELLKVNPKDLLQTDTNTSQK